MRRAILRTILLVAATGLWPNVVQAEERVLADEWTAEFEAGAKIAWAHQRIFEAAPVGGQRRFVLVNRGWTPVGDRMIVEEERVTTDSTGRVLRYSMMTKGPRGLYRVDLEGRSYRVEIRALAPVEGHLAHDAYDLGIVLALMRRGLLPPGRRQLRVLDLPGAGLSTRSFTMFPRDDGRWEFARGGQVVVRSRGGELVETVDKDRPRWSKRRTTAEQAPDCTVRDPAWPGDVSRNVSRNASRKSAQDSVAGPTVRVDAPPGPWVLRRQRDSYTTMVGMEHPLQTIVAALEFGVAMGVSERQRLELAAQVRAKLNRQRTLPTLGTPVPSRYRERDAVTFPLSGTVNMEPVTGRAHLVRSRTGQAVLVMAFYAADLDSPMAALIEEALGHVHLDAAEKHEAPWRRVKPRSGGLTLEVPGGWLRKGMADKWVSPQRMSSISVNEGTLPPGIDIARAQALWVSQMNQRSNLVDVQTAETGPVQLGGRTLHSTRVTARVVRSGQPDLPLTAVSVAYQRGDRTYVEVIAMAFEKDWHPAGVERALKSLRWDARPVVPGKSEK